MRKAACADVIRRCHAFAEGSEAFQGRRPAAPAVVLAEAAAAAEKRCDRYFYCSVRVIKTHLKEGADPYTCSRAQHAVRLRLDRVRDFTWKRKEIEGRDGRTARRHHTGILRKERCVMR